MTSIDLIVHFFVLPCLHVTGQMLMFDAAVSAVTGNQLETEPLSDF